MDQLLFGTNTDWLTPAQLSQIKFIDPVGFPPGANDARILPTGEVVSLRQATLYPVRLGDDIVLSWSNAVWLQAATNVEVPYLDTPEATSPYTNHMLDWGRKFFRLRQ